MGAEWTNRAFFQRLDALGLAGGPAVAHILRTVAPDGLSEAAAFVAVSRYRKGDREIPRFAWLWLAELEERTRLEKLLRDCDAGQKPGSCETSSLRCVPASSGYADPPSARRYTPMECEEAILVLLEQATRDRREGRDPLARATETRTDADLLRSVASLLRSPDVRVRERMIARIRMTEDLPGAASASRDAGQSSGADGMPMEEGCEVYAFTPRRLPMDQAGAHLHGDSGHLRAVDAAASAPPDQAGRCQHG